MDALAQFLPLNPQQKQRTVIRTDSGFGSDDNVNYALYQGWQVLTKGIGGRRPGAWAKQVAAESWHSLGKDRWLAPAVNPPTFVRPIQCFVLAWITSQGKTKYATLVCSVLEWSMEQVMTCYDLRGACETQIQADKGGLRLTQRRKHSLPAQEALVLLTDLAHNLLAWTVHWMALEPPLATFGTTRLIEELLAMPGRLYFDDGRLIEGQLQATHPHAAQVATALARLLDYFGNP